MDATNLAENLNRHFVQIWQKESVYGRQFPKDKLAVVSEPAWGLQTQLFPLSSGGATQGASNLVAEDPYYVGISERATSPVVPESGFAAEDEYDAALSIDHVPESRKPELASFPTTHRWQKAIFGKPFGPAKEPDVLKMDSSQNTRELTGRLEPELPGRGETPDYEDDLDIYRDLIKVGL